MPFSSPLTQGGQTLAHRLRMLRQIYRLAALCALLITGCFAAWQLKNVPRKVWINSWNYIRAEIAKKLDFSKNLSIGKRSLSIDWILKTYHRDIEELQKTLLRVFSRSILIFLGNFLLILFIFWKKGRGDRKNRHLSGQDIVSSLALRKLLKRRRIASDLQLGHLPIVKDSETQHLLITGTTGSGKTNCFHHILSQIRKKGQKALIVDTTGSFVERYFQEGKDILLNPFDQRSKSWHVWAECQEPYHYKELAKSLIPQTSHDPFWSTSAQTIFSILVEHLSQEKSTEKLLEYMLETPLDQLYDQLISTHHEGRRAISLLDPKSEKTATSIRSSAASYVDCLSYLEDTSTPFSIRNWIQDDTQTQWLFLTMMPDQRDTLRPLISTWTSIGIKSLLGKVPDTSSRCWFIIDELASMHQLQDITTGLAESRKYGGAIVLGIQNFGQFDAIYGPNVTSSIIDLCSTKISFRQTSPELAYRMSKAFGEREVTEIQEGISYGANDIRDGVNLSMITKQKPTLTPTEFYNLENLEAFIKLPGNLPLCKMTFKYNIQKKTIAFPFLKKGKTS